MKLTKPQLDQLKRWLQFKGRPLTIRSMILGSLPRYALIITALGGLAVYFWWRHEPVPSVFLGGYLLGILCREFQWLRLRSKFWPVNDHVTDWQRVEELVRENESGAP